MHPSSAYIYPHIIYKKYYLGYVDFGVASVREGSYKLIWPGEKNSFYCVKPTSTVVFIVSSSRNELKLCEIPGEQTN